MKMKKITWEDVEKMTDKIADDIMVSGFVPDRIIGITAGGLIPLYFLSIKLGLRRSILTVSVSSYDKQKRKEFEVMYLPQIDMVGERVLLVDEFADSGNTLEKMSKIIKDRYGVSQIKTATIALDRQKCRHAPDYHAFASEGEFVVFPWEKFDFPEYFQSRPKNIFENPRRLAKVFPCREKRP